MSRRHDCPSAVGFAIQRVSCDYGEDKETVIKFLNLLFDSIDLLSISFVHVKENNDESVIQSYVVGNRNDTFLPLHGLRQQ